MNCDLTIIPEVDPVDFGKYNAFDVKVICDPEFPGSDKELMCAVCQFLTEYINNAIEIRTHYVVHDATFKDRLRVCEIMFQVLTPLEPQWYC